MLAATSVPTLAPTASRLRTSTRSLPTAAAHSNTRLRLATVTSRRSSRVAFKTEGSEQGEMVMAKVGDSLPEATLYVLDKSLDDQRPVALKDVVSGKKVVIFGLPGAFTSVCSSKHLPGYSAKFEQLIEAGVDTICCTSINDAWVMDAWAKVLEVDSGKIMMLGDGDANLHRSLGLVQTLPGLGERPLRYSLYAEDGVIKVLNVDEPGPKSYKVSGPERMLEDLSKLKPSA